MLKPLPVSTYTFSDIIKGGYLYIDKTQYIYSLIHEPKGVYFLSRPRRFGKSLTISTLEEIFQGHKELFQGLWIDTSAYQWDAHPVIHIDFSRIQASDAEGLEVEISRHLARIAEQHQIELSEAPCYAQFDELITKLAKEKQVVILIDEYDKPIITQMENVAAAKRIRDKLKGFYSIIKALDAHIRFVFITGISKFSRAQRAPGVFSDLNHLVDLTMSPMFATALGITHAEMEAYFAGYITPFAQQQNLGESALLEKIRYWYDGFRFSENPESVYNPFSTMNLFQQQRFANYWFESGTPTFVVKLIREQVYDPEMLTKLEVAEIEFSTYELERLAIIPLLFQTGYLTIKDFRREGEEGIYTLAYPNYEVEHAFITYLLSEFSQMERSFIGNYSRQLLHALRVHDFTQFFGILDIFFANIPYEIHIKKEKYHQTIFYLIFLMIGAQADVEIKTNRGRIDTVVEFSDHIFLFEFKLGGTAKIALQQIKTNAYAQKYGLKGKTITLIGVTFDSKQRRVGEWKTEPLTS